MDVVSVRELWSLSENDVLAGLGRDVSDGRLGLTPNDLLELAMLWLDTHRSEICQCLRSIPVIASLANDRDGARRLEALAALADFLALAYGKSTAAWAATFVLRVGLSDFCSGTY